MDNAPAREQESAGSRATGGLRTRNGKTHAASRFYVLRLYVTGTNRASLQAIVNVRKFCQQHLRGHYELEVVDLHQQPALAKDKDVAATPTLVRMIPSPARRVVGDLSDSEKLLIELELTEKD